MRNKLYNKKHLGEYRKYLRNNSTRAEIVLWLSLKNKQLDGKKFRRQFSVGNYILDFYCPHEKLCIELDGAAHFTEEGKKYDEKRSAFLESEGIRVLRFENDLVLHRTETVLEMIKENLQ